MALYRLQLVTVVSGQENLPSLYGVNRKQMLLLKHFLCLWLAKTPSHPGYACLRTHCHTYTHKHKPCINSLPVVFALILLVALRNPMDILLNWPLKEVKDRAFGLVKKITY